MTLRPLTEEDWPLVHRLWNDPDIANSADANDRSYSIRELQEIMRTISQKAFCFVVEHRGEPVGECWLQEMNLDRILERYPGKDCRRIDIEIAKEHWGEGLGSEAIRLLVDFGFELEHAHAIFGCDVDYCNRGSLRAFQKAGFVPDPTIPKEADGNSVDLVITHQRWVEGALARPTKPR